MISHIQRLLLLVAAPVVLTVILLSARDRLAEMQAVPIDDPPALPPPAAGAAPVVHDLAALTPDEATALDGKRSRFLVTMTGGADRQKVGDVWRDVYEVLPLNDVRCILHLVGHLS